MPTKTVWIEVAREWMEFGVATRGRTDRVHRILVDSDHAGSRSQADDGAGIPPNLGQHIAHGLSMLGVAHGCVDVLWNSGGTFVDVHTVAAPPAAAAPAATLAFTTGNAIDPQSWATNAHIISTKKNAPQEHETSVLLSAVRLEVLSEIESAVGSAGCTLRTVVPAAATALLLAANSAVETSREAPDPLVCLHIGEHATAIAIAINGTLLLARTIEMGYATLRQAYRRATDAENASSAQAFLAANARLLETDGIPSPKDRDTIAIFDSVRPFLQRLVIEVKQTVRFTLEADKLEAARVHLIGPGASIPRLDEILAKEVGFERVEVAPDHPGASEPGFGIADAARIDASSLGVQPPGRVERHERSSRRAAILYGAVGAALVLAGSAYLSISRANTFERRARQLDQEISDWRTQAEAGRGMNPKALAEALSTLIDADSGLRADWGAALADSASVRPDGIWFTSVSGERDRDGSHLHFSALIPINRDGRDPHQQIAEFVEALQAGGLIGEARLGTTEQIRMGEKSCLRFSLDVDVIETRAPWLSAEASK